MKLVNGCFKLRVLCNVVFEHGFVASGNRNREITGLGVPVSLAFRGNQEFYKFPYSLLLCTDWTEVRPLNKLLAGGQ